MYPLALLFQDKVIGNDLEFFCLFQRKQRFADRVITGVYHVKDVDGRQCFDFPQDIFCSRACKDPSIDVPGCLDKILKPFFISDMFKFINCKKFHSDSVLLQIVDICFGTLANCALKCGIKITKPDFELFLFSSKDLPGSVGAITHLLCQFTYFLFFCRGYISTIMQNPIVPFRELKDTGYYVWLNDRNDLLPAQEEPYFSKIDRSKLPPRVPNIPFDENTPSILKTIRKEQNIHDYSEAEWDELRACYLGMCMKVDEQVGMLCEALKNANIYDDTAIFFFSDHGDFAGVVPNHTQFGRSLKTVLADHHKEVRKFVTCEGGRLAEENHCSEVPTGLPELDYEYRPRMVAQADPDSHTKATMLRTKDFKYVNRLYEADELYDLQKDPKETKNVIHIPEYRDIAVEMRKAMLDWYQETCDVVPFQEDARFPIKEAWKRIRTSGKLPIEKVAEIDGRIAEGTFSGTDFQSIIAQIR